MRSNINRILDDLYSGKPIKFAVPKRIDAVVITRHNPEEDEPLGEYDEEQDQPEQENQDDLEERE